MQNMENLISTKAEEDLRTYRLKHSGNNKDEENSLIILNDKNQQALSQKFRQLLSITEPNITTFIK